MSEWISHPFEPFHDTGSRVLILGTMPSPRSRAENFYYGHPQNRFWRILGDMFGESIPSTMDEKKDLLHRHHIALWDVLSGCEISGADDSSIRNPIPNDLSKVFTASPIKAVFTNGSKASGFYKKFFSDKYGIEWISLPSTSPANCRNWTYETLLSAYRVILHYL